MTGRIKLRDMTPADIDVVLHIEQQVHGHPWTRGMFSDSLANGYICKIVEEGSEIAGFVVLMPALDEVHLLDISIASKFQRKGMGEKLLGEMLTLARERKFERMILEVRRSNLAAGALYRKLGFGEIGVRRGYYPKNNGRAENSESEDAIVMERKLK